MNQSRILTAEEAKNLTFPCLLEVIEVLNPSNVKSHHALVVEINSRGSFVTEKGHEYYWAKFPSPQVAEIMRNQFGTQSEYPKRMLVWDYVEEEAQPRIVLADLGKKAKRKYIVVCGYNESNFESAQNFGWTYYNHAKPIPEPDPISQEIAELRQRIADLEAKHNQQSK